MSDQGNKILFFVLYRLLELSVEGKAKKSQTGEVKREGPRPTAKKIVKLKILEQRQGMRVEYFKLVVLFFLRGSLKLCILYWRGFFIIIGYSKKRIIYPKRQWFGTGSSNYLLQSWRKEHTSTLQQNLIEPQPIPIEKLQVEPSVQQQPTTSDSNPLSNLDVTDIDLAKLPELEMEFLPVDMVEEYFTKMDDKDSVEEQFAKIEAAQEINFVIDSIL